MALLARTELRLIDALDAADATDAIIRIRTWFIRRASALSEPATLALDDAERSALLARIELHSRFGKRSIIMARLDGVFSLERVLVDRCVADGFSCTQADRLIWRLADAS